MTATVALAARELDGPAEGAVDLPPLLVMHGLLGSSRNWQAHGKALARERRVLLIDLRNHGASPWSDVMDYPAMAADVQALADAQGIERFALLGHSMGGKVAMAVALAAPARVERMVVADIAPVTYRHTFSHYVEAMQHLDLARIGRRAMADAALAPSIEDAGIRQFLLQNLEFDGNGGAYWKPNLAVLDAAMTTLTGWPEDYAGRTYDGPTLAIRGGASAYVDEAGMAAFQSLMPAVTFETLEGAGHWLHAEAPRPFLEAVQRFLDH